MPRWWSLAQSAAPRAKRVGFKITPVSCFPAFRLFFFVDLATRPRQCPGWAGLDRVKGRVYATALGGMGRGARADVLCSRLGWALRHADWLVADGEGRGSGCRWDDARRELRILQRAGTRAGTRADGGVCWVDGRVGSWVRCWEDGGEGVVRAGCTFVICDVEAPMQDVTDAFG